MQKLNVPVILLVAVASCGKPSNQAKCEKGFAQMTEVLSAMGKGMGAEGTGAEVEKAKADFVATCTQLPDDAVDCVAHFKEKMTDEKCNATMNKITSDMNKKRGAQAAAAIKFVATEVDHKRVTAMVPEGWPRDNLGAFAPPKAADLGFFTRVDVSSTCGGACNARSAADWEKVVAENEFAFLKEGVTVVKDEKIGATGRIVVYDKKDGMPAHKIAAAFWSEGGEQYVYCRAELDDKLAAASAEFEKACRSTKVISFSSTYSE